MAFAQQDQSTSGKEERTAWEEAVKILYCHNDIMKLPKRQRMRYLPKIMDDVGAYVAKYDHILRSNQL